LETKTARNYLSQQKLRTPNQYYKTKTLRTYLDQQQQSPLYKSILEEDEDARKLPEPSTTGFTLQITFEKANIWNKDMSLETYWVC
jgi:hypothetical protein